MNEGLCWFIANFITLAIGYAIVVIQCNKEKSKVKDAWLLLGMFLIHLSGLFCSNMVESRCVQPIDVYRGKTELKLDKTIINDSIVNIDTTVIFKQSK